jgi:uncharacterized protein YkwD
MTTSRTRSRLVVLLMLGMTLAATSAVPSVHARPHTAHRQPSDNELRDKMLRLVDRSRVNRGLPRLKLNVRLSREAYDHARHMAREGELTHTPNLADLISDVGGTVYGENLGKGRGLRGIRDAWLRSEITSRILLDARFHHVGLGVVHVDGFYWVTLQVFD